jgi:hypothetical protein
MKDNRPFAILGYFEYVNMTTAGQWTNTPTQLQVFGAGMRKPGEIVSMLYTTSSTVTTINTSAFTSTSLTAVFSLQYRGLALPAACLVFLPLIRSAGETPYLLAKCKCVVQVFNHCNLHEQSARGT